MGYCYHLRGEAGKLVLVFFTLASVVSMASHNCCFCGIGLDSRYGHRECPSCLGKAHLLEDVENPCPAAVDMSLEERARRAGLCEIT